MKNQDIDRQIAEKVMGWELRPLYGLGWWNKSDTGKLMQIRNIFNPSTDITHAFEVVRKMKKKNYCFTLADYSPISKLWEAEFINDNNGKSFISTTNTPEMAICLAALKAINDLP